MLVFLFGHMMQGPVKQLGFLMMRASFCLSFEFESILILLVKKKTSMLSKMRVKSWLNQETNIGLIVVRVLQDWFETAAICSLRRHMRMSPGCEEVYSKAPKH